MIKNYLVLFIRNLSRQKLFSAINLLGLTTGIASTLVIYLYVQNDFSHDRFHKNANRIYRINQTNILGGNDQRQLARTGPGVGEALKSELPEVEMVSSIHTPGSFAVSYVNGSNDVIVYNQENILAGDSNFFKMFSFQVVKGNPETCLIHPESVVVTESTALKYFGNEESIGKLLQMGVGETARTFQITAVVKDIPDNSYIDFDILMSMSSFPHVKQNSSSWVWTQLETFVLLDKNSDLEKIQIKLKSIPRQYAESSLQAAMNMSFDDYVKTGRSWQLFTQPLTQIHLHSDNVDGNSNLVGNKKITYTLTGAAIFIILLSCINFMNLSAAQLTKRMRVASIQKILGLARMELALGYFVEAFAFCLLAMVAAFASVQILMPSLHAVTGRGFEMDLAKDPALAGILILILLFMSLLAGGFSALYLTHFQPVEAIKGKGIKGKGGKSLRNGLVVIQFAVSIVLVICTTIVFQQLKFFAEKDLGFNEENLLIIDHLERIENGGTLTEVIADIPGVLAASFCAAVPLRMDSDLFRPKNAENKDFKLQFTAADEYYLPTLKVPLLIGRNFSSSASDVNKVILNETAVKAIGWKMDESIIGKIIDYPNENTTFQVIGVLRDYHFTSLETRIEPMAIFHIKSKVYSRKKYALVRIAEGTSKSWESMFITLKNAWKRHAGDLPFEYKFVDQEFDARLQTQQQFSLTLQIMASLALLIASLGLIGMVIYTLERRTKEIGIRKISGASLGNILVLISQGYTKLIIIAFCVSAPISYWLVQEWLQDFENRITPSAWVYIMAGLGTLLLSYLITGYHSVKAALANPVEALKDE